MNQNLNNLANFIESLPAEEVDQRDPMNCAVGIGNRVNNDFTGFIKDEEYGERRRAVKVSDPRFTEAEQMFADRYNVTPIEAEGIFVSNYSVLDIGMEDVESENWSNREWMQAHIVEMFRALANKETV